MPTRRTLLVRGALACVLLAGVAVGALAWSRRGDPLEAEYPPAPFPRVDDDYPRHIAVREVPPRADKAAYDAYWEERREIQRRTLHELAMADATEDEREAYRHAVYGSKYVAAKDLALGTLREKPDSAAARFVLAVVEHEGEGNFPRALFLVRSLRRQMHRRGEADPADAVARDWYLRLLYLEWSILRDMNRYEEALRALARIEEIYEPLPDRRIWPLLKLRRLDEADAALAEAERDGRWEHDLHNDRLVLAFERRDRAAIYAAGLAAAKGDEESIVVWNNHGDACQVDFRFAETEEAWLRSTRSRAGGGNFTPFTDLAALLATKGQFVEAWDALHKGQRDRKSREPHSLVMDQYRFDKTLAFVLCLLGRNEDGLAFARRAVERPRRTGQISFTDEEIDFGNRFTLRVHVLARSAELREHAAAGGSQAEAARAELAALERERWILEPQILRLLADESLLVRLLVPYAPSCPSPESLFYPDVVRLLPAGIARSALARARASKTQPQAAPHFEDLDAEIAWRAGRHADALTAARAALAALDPTYERTLRARLSVLAADAALRTGETDAARAYFDQALADCPVAFRLLEVPVPVKVVADDSPLAGLVAETLLRSPRFRGDPDGFPILLRGDGGKLGVDMFRAGDVRHFADSVALDRAEGETDEDVAARVVRRVGARLCSPRLDLKPTEIHALDNGLFTAPDPRATNRLLQDATPK